MRPNDELLQKIGQVRSKWKAFVWMRGLAWVLGLLVAALAIGIYLATVTSVSLSVIRNISLVFAGAHGGRGSVEADIAAPPCAHGYPTGPIRRRKESRVSSRVWSAPSRRSTSRKPSTVAFSFLLIKDALERTKNVRFGETINKKKFNIFAAINGALVLAFLIGLFLASIVHARRHRKVGCTRWVLHRRSTRSSLRSTPGKRHGAQRQRRRREGRAFRLRRAAAERSISSMRTARSGRMPAMDVVPDGDKPTYQFRLFNLQEQVQLLRRYLRKAVRRVHDQGRGPSSRREDSTTRTTIRPTPDWLRRRKRTPTT